jgi:electron transfer flavoprotein beta subunit
VKICVLVKEVPDAAVEKRLDPDSKRMDRSGEKNLNPFDTHAIEAAMQIREGGSVDVDEIVAVTMGPESAVRAAHGLRILARATMWQLALLLGQSATQ